MKPRVMEIFHFDAKVNLYEVVEMPSGSASDTTSSFEEAPQSPQGFTAIEVKKNHAETYICTKWLILAIVSVIIHPFLFGFGVTQLNSSSFHDNDDSQVILYEGHSDLEWTFAVNLWAVGGFIGSLTGGWLADKFGRSKALFRVSSPLTLIAGLLGVFSQSMYWIICSRFVLGLGSGLAMAIVPVYISEVAPPRLVGVMGGLTQLSITCGSMVASAFIFLFATEDLWRVQLGGVPLVLTALACIGSFFVVESPRWTIVVKKMPSKAAQLVLHLWGSDVDAEIYIKEALEAAQAGDVALGSRTSVSLFRQLSGNQGLRRAARIGPLLQMTALSSGISATMNYSSDIFSDIGVEDTRVGTLMMNVVNWLSTGAALFLIFHFGRKNLLIASTLGCIGMCAVFTIAAVAKFNVLGVVAVAAHAAFFEFGLGPISYLIVPEVLPLEFRASGAALAMSTQYSVALFIGIAFPYWNAALGNATLVPFAVGLGLGLCWILWDVPETKGKNPMDIYKELGMVEGVANLSRTKIVANSDLEDMVQCGPSS